MYCLFVGEGSLPKMGQWEDVGKLMQKLSGLGVWGVLREAGSRVPGQVNRDREGMWRVPSWDSALDSSLWTRT